MNIKSKLTLSYVFIAVLSIGLTGYTLGNIAIENAEKTILKIEESYLTSIREGKKNQIESYFNTIRSQILSMADDTMMINASKEFTSAYNSYLNQYFDADFSKMKASLEEYYANQFGGVYNESNSNSNLDPVSLLNMLDNESIALQYSYISNNPNALGEKDGLMASDVNTTYDKVHKKYHSHIRGFLQKFEFYDIFIVEPESGDIIYSVFKELDYTTSLKDGPYANSGIAQAFLQANRMDKGQAFLTDFKPYTPSYEAQASFIGTPVYDNNGNKVAILIFQMPVDRINQIMTYSGKWVTSGLGNSGESYIIGEDYTMRSQSRFLLEDQAGYAELLLSLNFDASLVDNILAKGSSVGLQPVETKGTKSALSGNTGFDVFADYRNVRVFSAYTPLEIENLNWILMSEIDESEALESFYALSNEIYSRAYTILAVVSLLACIIGYLISRSLAKNINFAGRIASNISSGKLDNEIHTNANANDEIGKLLRALEQMQSELDRKNKMDIYYKNQIDAIGKNQIVVEYLHTGEVVSVNQNFSDKVGYSEEQAKNIQAKDLMANSFENKNEFDNFWTKILSDGTVSGEYQKRARDGSEVWTQSSFNLVFDEVNNTKKVIEYGIDITKRKEATTHIQGLLMDMSDGNLQNMLEGDYPGEFNQIKVAVNDTISKLSSLIGEILVTSSNANSTFNQTAKDSDKLQVKSEEQIQSLAKTTKDIQKMNQIISDNETIADNVKALSVDTKGKAEHGGNVVVKVISAISEIEESSKKISDIVGVIDGISFQTNLLSLNAAVEAARAGESGKGFAVVASEVGSLAKVSSSSAKEITALINDIVKKIDDGTVLAHESGESLDVILNSISTLDESISSIYDSSKLQSSTVSTINSSVSEMKNITEYNSALIGDISGSISGVKKQLQQLMNQASIFQVK